MADVYGRIGNEQVELTNAATEATLRQLLAAVSGAGGKMAANVGATAARALGPLGQTAGQTNKAMSGFNASVAQIGAGLGAFGSGLQKTGTSVLNVIDATQQLTRGTGEASGAFSALGRLGGVAGIAFEGMARLARFQEQNLNSYRNMTTAGVNFGGSLTELRLSASRSYMTLDNFTAMITKNGETLARMGGTADEGARAFSNLSNRLIKSPLGDKLLSLGYTTDAINQNMLTYINQTGGRTREEMANTEAIKKATTSYMVELDALTSLTGKSKKEIEEESKKASQNAAFQRKLSTMTEEERAKVMIAMNKAASSGIAGATDLVVAEVLGLPPLLKDAQMLMAMAPEAAAGIKDMVVAARSNAGTIDDINKGFGRVMLGAAEAAKGLGTAGDAFTVMGGDAGKISSGLIGMQVTMNAQGITNAEEFAAHQEKIRREQEERTKSEAARATQTQKALQEMGTTILENVMPTINQMLNGDYGLNNMIGTLNEYTQGFDNFLKSLKPMVDFINDIPILGNILKLQNGFDLLLKATVVLTGAFLILKSILIARELGGLIGGLGGGRPGTGPTVPPGTGGRPPAPGTPGGTPAPGTPGTGRTPPARMGRAGMLASLFAGIGGAAIFDYATNAGLFGGGAQALPTPVAAGAGEVVEEPPTKTEEPVVMPDEQVNYVETLVEQMSILNNQTAEAVALMRETAENTRRTFEAARRLDGNLFPRAG